MAINFLLKRSNVASKRPTAAQLDIGELSLNYDANTAGVFFEDSAGNIRKVGPAEVSATAPNATPAGSSGNSLGELWYDTGTSNLKIWTGSSFVESRASVATLTTTRTLWGQNFNGSANVTGSLTSVGDITATAAINITSATTNAITVDSGTTGNVNLGTGANAKAIAIGNSGVASTIALNNSTTITGNLTVDTSTLFVDATNNRVGINTTSPAFSFQVGATGAGGVAINESLSAIFGTFGAGGNLTLRAQTTATGGGGQVYLGGSTRGDVDKNLVRFDTNGVVRGCFAEDGVFHVGGRHISATPAAGTISGVGGSGTDISGASLTIRGGLGTGTGVGGDIIFSTAAAGTTGSTLNSATQRMRIDSSGNLLPEADNTYTLGSSALRWSGVSSAAFNKVTITEPATSATLTIANTKTLTVSNTLTFTGTDSSSIAFGTGGTVAYTGGTLAQFAATTSSQLAGVISDETGSGALVFGTSPAITTSLTTGSASFDLINATATTVNFAGAATTLAIGGASGTLTIGNATITGTNATALNLNGASPSIATTSTGTASVFNTNALTGNLFGAATAITIGATSGSTELRHSFRRAGNISSASWTNAGVSANFAAATFTDTSTAAAGTVALRAAVSVNTPTFDSTNLITVTDAASFYISAAPVAGANSTLTNRFALWVDSGTSRFDSMVDSRATLNWNFGQLTLTRNSSNTASTKIISILLDGDSVSSTTLTDNANLVLYTDSAPTTGSTSVALNAGLGLTAPKSIRFLIDGSERARFNASGYLGIGVTDARRQLEVAGATEANIILNRTGGGVDEKSWRMYTDTAKTFLVTAINDALSAEALAYTIGRGTGTAITSHRFFVGGAEKITATATGVGIAQSSPGSVLDVNGNISFSASLGECYALSSANWNYAHVNFKRTASNTSIAKFLNMILDGDSTFDTTLTNTLCIWGTYSGTPTAASTSTGLNAVMNLGAPSAVALHANGSEGARLDSTRRLLVGATTARANFNNTTDTAVFQVEGANNNTARFTSQVYGQASTSGPYHILAKTRSNSLNGVTAVQYVNGANASDDQLGTISFQGSDGTEFVEGASIQAYVDATPGANDMPGRLVFSTTADGASSATERMRITNVGNVKIGGSANRATTEGTNQLVLFDGTAPVGTLANGVSFYSTAGEARVMDAAGNATLLSPHDKETNEWIYDSVDTRTGKHLRIRMEALMRFINEHFGLDFVEEFMEEVSA